MLQIICKTDPMSGKELDDIAGLPYVEQLGKDTGLTIYFESEANRKAYLDIPIEQPISELSINLDNPTDEWIDEG